MALKRGRVLGIAVCAALAMGGIANARGDMSAQDLSTMRGYVLTVDKVNRFTAATQAMKKDVAKNPGLKSEADRAGDEKAPTIADMIAKLKRHPNIAGYYRKAGLSELDAAVLPVVVMSAALAQAVPAAKRGELPVTAAQIAFVQQHQKELTAMMASGNDD